MFMMLHFFVLRLLTEDIIIFIYLFSILLPLVLKWVSELLLAKRQISHLFRYIMARTRYIRWDGICFVLGHHV